MWRWRRKNELRVPAQIEMDASQARDYCIAKSATLRAVRPQIPHHVKNACLMTTLQFGGHDENRVELCSTGQPRAAAST
jgi:hypothetical protein